MLLSKAQSLDGELHLNGDKRRRPAIVQCNSEHWHKNFLLHEFYIKFNPDMHKVGPRRPKHYIFGDQFYCKNAWKLRFHVFLHCYAGKYMIP